MDLIYREKPSGFTGKGQTPVISWWDKDFCCVEMEEMWNDKQYGQGRIGVDETGINVRKDKRVTLHFKDCYEDDVEHIYKEINYCPFCGKPIRYK